MYSEYLRDNYSTTDLSEWIGRRIQHPCAISKASGEFIWANKEWCESLEYTYDEIINDVSWKDLTTSVADLQADERATRRLINGEETRYEVFKDYLTKSRIIKPVFLTVEILEREGKESLFLVQFRVIGTAESRAIQITADQVAKMAAEMHQVTVALKELIDAWSESQWFGRLCSRASDGIMQWCWENQSKVAFTFLGMMIFTAVALMGQRAIETLKLMFSIFL